MYPFRVVTINFNRNTPVLSSSGQQFQFKTKVFKFSCVKKQHIKYKLDYNSKAGEIIFKTFNKRT